MNNSRESKSSITLPELSQEEVLRYSRHMMIPEVGLEGQRKLKAASVLVVGSGGLGSPVALYLAAAGVGRIGLVDYDRVDSSNLQRQVIHGTDRIGMLKVESARIRMLDLNPFIQVDIYNKVLSSENALDISEDYDILIDGSDNFPTRYLLNDLAVLSGKTYVYGSVFRFEGQASVFDARVGACYRCLFPEPPPPGSVPTCAEGGVFGILPGTIGTIQATETIKIILGVGATLSGRLLLYDALEMSFHLVHLRKNQHCRICSLEATITDLIDYEAFCGAPLHDLAPETADAALDIMPIDLARRMRQGDAIQLVDVREAVELQIVQLPGAIPLPLGQLAGRLDELDAGCETVVFCRTGTRSRRALEILQNAGFKKVWNLWGGTNAWARQIDPSLMQY